MRAISHSSWELQILDADPPSRTLDSLGTGDIDGDGQMEIVTGGNDALLWYRPATLEKGIIASGHFHVGIACEDIDADGFLEVVVGEEVPGGTEQWRLVFFKPTHDLSRPWSRQVLDPRIGGGPHDILFADIDHDGEREIVANAVYSSTPALYVYKRSPDPGAPWHKHTIQAGIVGEGLAVADLDGDGRVEIINGPDWFTCPTNGPFSGPWARQTFAPAHREMCRVALADITGNGRPDIVLVDSEYLDGTLSWFENRLQEDPAHPWLEHQLEGGLVYAHSLAAWRTPQPEAGVQIFVAEMMQGGWHAPQNHNARLLKYSSTDGGQTWQRAELSRGEGTHQACVSDLDGDGRLEIIGKDAFEDIYQTLKHPKMQIWKEVTEPSPLAHLHHRFLDRDKPATGIEVVCADVDGDGRQDIICGSWWYHNPTWQRFAIPNIYQVSAAYDLDGDGRVEFIATKARAGETHWYAKLSSELYWLKAVDPLRGIWEEHFIGQGNGDWPHGVTIGPLLPGGQVALVVGYHNANEHDDHPHARGQVNRHPPEIFRVPADPTRPWPRAVLADVPFGEEMAICDVDGDGTPDIVAGKYWFENRGDGTFQPHTITASFDAARLAVMDINGNGRPDVVLGEEVLDFQNSVTPKSRLAWFENPGPAGQEEWTMHVIDMLRCPHSIGIGDLDGDGELEIVCGEHDPFWPYRSQCRLLIYKKADPRGLTWKRYTVDDRFEHHDGARVFEIAPGKMAVVSHGWVDNIYLHLWEVPNQS